MWEWMKKNSVIVVVSLLALVVIVGPAVAQSVDLYLGRALKTDGEAITVAGTDRAITVGGTDGSNYYPALVDATGAFQVDATITPVAAATVATGTIACTDAGASVLLNAATVTARIWNTSTTDEVCVALAAAPSHGTPSECEAQLEPWAGNGTANLIYETPSGLAVGGQTIYCDMAAGKTATVTVVEYRK